MQPHWGFRHFTTKKTGIGFQGILLRWQFAHVSANFISTHINLGVRTTVYWASAFLYHVESMGRLRLVSDLYPHFALISYFSNSASATHNLRPIPYCLSSFNYQVPVYWRMCLLYSKALDWNLSADFVIITDVFTSIKYLRCKHPLLTCYMILLYLLSLTIEPFNWCYWTVYA